MLINNLIRLYYHVCHKYKEQICWQVQRFSNNHQLLDAITDEELITIYLFCVAYEEKYKIKSMHRHIKNYWQFWFPKLPSYQAFNARLNHLCDAFAILIAEFLSQSSICAKGLQVMLGDSFPVVTCSHKRSGKVARELTDKGFYVVKKLHYYGVKVHLLGARRSAQLPLPQYIDITPASVHDLTAARDMFDKTKSDAVVLDKAYADIQLAKRMQAGNCTLSTPIKDKRG